ncbi:MAG: putative aminohydrolase SsnA [Clostridia bacterium]|nr:putative aminohydrolase SsnA [Clostridia bacterium]
MLLIANGMVLTRDGGRFIADGGVAIDGERIAAVGETEALRRAYPKAEYMDAKGKLIMPGLVNAHTHIYSALARGMSIGGYAPESFYDILDGLWWKLDRRLDLEATRCSAYATLIDCIKQGVTTVFDHHASYGSTAGSLFAIADVASELGVRACLCYEVSDRDGEAKCREAIAENVAFMEHCESLRSDMLKAMFGMHAAFTLSDSTMKECVRQNAGRVGFHIHVAEGMDDVRDSLDNYGVRTVRRLYDAGIMGEKSIFGHCVHIDEGEMELIASTGTAVVNCPESNMGNAVGCSPVLELFGRGALVGLGTDAYTNDMLESLKVELAMQRHNAGKPNVAWSESEAMLFDNNPRIAERHFGVPLGVLRPGAAADVIVVDYKPFTPISGENAHGHILFGVTGRQCDTTIVNGRVLMRGRELTGVDETSINERITESADALWRAIC